MDHLPASLSEPSWHYHGDLVADIMDPFARGDLDGTWERVRLISALDLHSRITLLEDAARACRAELQRRPSHCQQPPPPQPAASSSSCMLLQLSQDEMGVVAHELCDPLRPLLAVNLGSTAKGLRALMQAELAQLKQQRQEAEAFAALTNTSIEELRGADNLDLGHYYQRPLTLAYWRTIGNLIGCGSLPMLEYFSVDGADACDEGVVLLAAGLSRGRPSLLHLGLTGLELGDQAASALASALLMMPTIQELHLQDNHIGDSGLLALAPALRWLPLQRLEMWRNNFGDRGLAALLAQAFASRCNPSGVLKSLFLLDLSQNHITDAGCAAFVSALRSGALPGLEQVDLRAEDYGEFSPAHAKIFEVRDGLRPPDEDDSAD